MNWWDKAAPGLRDLDDDLMSRLFQAVVRREKARNAETNLLNIGEARYRREHGAMRTGHCTSEMSMQTVKRLSADIIVRGSSRMWYFG